MSRGKDYIGLGAQNNRADLEKFAEGKTPSRNIPLEELDEEIDSPGLPQSTRRRARTPEANEPEPHPEPVHPARNPDGNPESSASREPKKNPEGLRFYSANDVLAGWRAYDPHRKEFRDGGGDGVPMPASFTMSKPGERDDFEVDTRMLMFLHVEKFFAANIEWHAAKAFMMYGRDCDAVKIAFEVWYESNPMMIALAQSERATMQVPEYLLLPLAEAVNRFNSSGKLKVIYDSALKAAQKGRLNASRPEGRWHTTMADIASWQKVEKDRDKAA